MLLDDDSRDEEECGDCGRLPSYASSVRSKVDAAVQRDLLALPVAVLVELWRDLLVEGDDDVRWDDLR